jgi:hypothetical protein
VNTVPPPPERDLPPGEQDRRRRELVALIRAEQAAVEESARRRRRYTPPITAATVAAVVVGAFALGQVVPRDVGETPAAAEPARLTQAQAQAYLTQCLTRNTRFLASVHLPARAAAYRPVLTVTDPDFRTSRRALVVAASAQGRAVWCHGSPATTIRVKAFAPGVPYDSMTRFSTVPASALSAIGSASAASTGSVWRAPLSASEMVVAAENRFVAVADWMSHRDLVMAWGRYSPQVTRVTVQYNGGAEHDVAVVGGLWADARRVPPRPLPPESSAEGLDGLGDPSKVNLKALETAYMANLRHVVTVRGYDSSGRLLHATEPKFSCEMVGDLPSCKRQDIPPAVSVDR